MAKRISSDKEHIDYIGTKWGVRVRNGVCRPLALTAEGKWEEYDDFYRIPVSPSARTALQWRSCLDFGPNRLPRALRGIHARGIE